MKRTGGYQTGGYVRQPPEMSVLDKLWQINWGVVALILMLVGIGFAMLYSSANGSLEPWAMRQMLRCAIGLVAMIAIACLPMRYWMRWAYALYGATILLLVAVKLQGTISGGAQRWLSLGLFQLQPSELMKITLALALARYFHGATIEDTGRWRFLLPALGLIGLPIFLVVRQPDLGTALMLAMESATLLLLVGVRWWNFALAAVGVAGLLPVAWSLMRDYQKERILVFLDPGRDPLGAGYHIIQSKIALGSGGFFGKGFLQGSQSHLNFLPEKQTDFIFTMLAEEMGLIGGLMVLGLYGLFMIYGYAVALRASSQFGRLLAIGIATSILLAVFINTAMVMGLIPAKGVPLPLISYGGTSLIVTLCGIGLIMNVWLHRDVRLSRRGEHER